MEVPAAPLDLSTWFRFCNTKTPLSSHKAGVARGEGTQCITELTHSLMPHFCEDGGLV